MASRPLPSLAGLLLRSIATLPRQAGGALAEAGLAATFAVNGIDQGQLARYRSFFGFRPDRVPLTYFYLLAQRAQIALMLDEGFPHAIPGLVHAENELSLHAAPEAERPLEIRVSASPSRAANDAMAVLFTVEASQSGRAVISCRSEYRVPRKRPRQAQGNPGSDIFPPGYAQEAWHPDKAIARRYALLSGDFNPIHLSALAARAFGFRQAIVHGMYAVGRAAAGIESHTEQPVVAIGARFKRPIPVSAPLILGIESPARGQGSFGVMLASESKLAICGNWRTGRSERQPAEIPA